MDPTLRTYRKKRDFGRTPEPPGVQGRSSTGRLYIIQKHAATRLHYDLRLEHDGVLKSWAVPKGPSLDPTDRRLAVEVEDHPIDYGSFEGVIPEGEYGGGTVLLWDRGRWVPEGDPGEQLEAGKLSFRLEGEKLTGRSRLVRTPTQEDRKPQWLLIKVKDEAAQPRSAVDITEARPESVLTGRTLDEVGEASDRVWHSDVASRGKTARPALDASTIPGACAASLPAGTAPQLPTPSEIVPCGDDWLHEIQLDGYRLLSRVEGNQVQIFSSEQQEVTSRLPDIVSAPQQLDVRTAWFDGELVAVQPDGCSSPELLREALTGARQGELKYDLFDLLYIDRYDLSSSPLEARKEWLAQLLVGQPADRSLLRYRDHVVGRGDEVAHHARRLRLPALLSKKRQDPYQAGPSDDWPLTPYPLRMLP